MDVQNKMASNALTLETELAWFSAVAKMRIDQKFERELPQNEAMLQPPEHDPEASIYANFIQHYGMSPEERLIVLLALIPYIRPQLLDLFFQTDEQLNRGCTALGGIQGKMHGGFLPTGETALFLLAGDDLQARFEYQQMFESGHYFARHNLLKLEMAPVGEPPLSAPLVIADEIVDFLTRGDLRKPDFSREFPAKLISSGMEWAELVLASGTQEQINELIIWMRHEKTLMDEWELGRRLRPGYKTLFYGPPGTGKTLTATLLGKRLERDVYRIALSSVVSKYIGETEKNLERIFGSAENMNCILFFDEADALFGKRTNVSDAHDRYANQEVSYLLQRIEEFPGVVILASNFCNNIDEAFMRRFQAVVHFPIPNVDEREQLWNNAFSKHSSIAEDWNIREVAIRYELSGGAIMNVIRYASLMAIDAGTKVIQHDDVINGIRRELQKEGKTL